MHKIIKKELKKILNKVDKIYNMLEQSPDMRDTSIIDIKELKKLNSTIDKVFIKVDEVSGDIAELIEIEEGNIE